MTDQDNFKSLAPESIPDRGDHGESFKKSRCWPQPHIFLKKDWT